MFEKLEKKLVNVLLFFDLFKMKKKIPEDFTGFDPEYRRYYQVDPYPFNHPTKIVVLKVKRK